MPRIQMLAKVLVISIVLAMPCVAEEETVDIEFLEWLGQAGDIEDLGVDINELLAAQEKKAQSESDEEESK